MKFLNFKIIFTAISLLSANFIVAQTITRKQYIEQYKDIAIRQMKSYGIPASIILAQGCLESGNGNSRLAVKANNHFGIKCHNWTGKRLYHDDDKRGECFRKYNNSEDSYKDHSEFLRNGKRYQSLFDLNKTDYKMWAHGLKAAGYATNPQYAKLLIDIIEKDELYKYDTNWASKEIQYSDKKAKRAYKKQLREERRAQKNAVKNNTGAMSAVVPIIAATPLAAAAQGAVIEDIENLTPLKNSNLYRYSMDRQIYQENSVPYIISTHGDSYQTLAKEYNLFTKELLGFNDVQKEVPIKEGTIIYIKRKKKEGNKKTHVVTTGETMYQISQKNGIRLQSLYNINNMKYGTQAEDGKILNLKK